MCSPKIPKMSTPEVSEPIAAPTQADAKVQKKGADSRQRAAAANNRNVKTNTLGDTSTAETQKKNLLGE